MIPLSDLNQIEKSRRYWSYLGACKVWLNSVHLVKSYVHVKFFWNGANFETQYIFTISLLYEVPGGNLVDGLPPAASTS